MPLNRVNGMQNSECARAPWAARACAEAGSEFPFFSLWALQGTPGPPRLLGMSLILQQ